MSNKRMLDVFLKKISVIQVIAKFSKQQQTDKQVYTNLTFYKDHADPHLYNINLYNIYLYIYKNIITLIILRLIPKIQIMQSPMALSVVLKSALVCSLYAF